MGPQEDYIETVVTCEGDFHDPQLQDRLRHFKQRLESLLLEDGKKRLILKKVEPWNSVRITFSIPRQAALRLKQLAQQGNATLRQIGVLGVQIQGDRLVSLTVATANNQRAELIISTLEGSGHVATLGTHQNASVGTSFDPGLPSSSEEQGSPGPNMEVTRKNIEEYLRQGSLLNSIATPACAPGPSRAGPSHDILKTCADVAAFRMNNIVVDGLPGPSVLPGVVERFVVSDGHGPGPISMQQAVSMPVPGQRGPRLSVAPHSAHRPPKYGSQPKQQHQQHLPLSASNTVSLPQTAALGYSMGLPPPPPYPLGHGAGVANNVGRQGKKPPASSPLLINLLQTDPVAGTNNIMAAPGTEKKLKKHRKRKDRPSPSGTMEGPVVAQGIPSIPPELDSCPVVPCPQAIPSQEEMSAVLHRRVSPVPLPSPRLGAGSSKSVPMSADLGSAGEGFRDRNTSTASAALASLAQNQKSASESEQVSDNSIINPYTGHMEPRDSASDLSPVKQDQHKPRKSSLTECTRIETSVLGVGVNTQVSLAAAKEELKSSSDSVRVGLGSFQPGATVPNSLCEDRPRGYPSSMMTAVMSSEHSSVSDSLFGQSPGAGHARVTTESSTLPISAASLIYAQQTFGPSQPLSRAPHVAPQHSTHTRNPSAGTPTVNGPVYITTPTCSFAVSGQLSTESHLHKVRGSLEGGFVDPYRMASHKRRLSVHGDVVHSVSVGPEAKMEDTGGQFCGDAGSHQPVSVSNTQPLTHKTMPALEMRSSVTSVSTVASQAQSDTLKLLNSSVSLGVGQRLAMDSAIPTASTTSPAAIKTPSDGEDNNSNHSGISPVSTVAPAPSSLLDTNNTKVDNHDSGMGSSSERSDDTTPSEAGDGEFQTGVPTTEASSAAENSGNKTAVVMKKTVVNCKERKGSSEANTITVGYVQMNQHSTNLYKKETKKYMAESSSLIGDKSVSVDETLREVANMINSSTSTVSATSSMALASHKDFSVSLPLPAKINSLSYQQVLKHKASANYQVSDVRQNGPSSLGGQPQHPPGQQQTVGNRNGGVYHSPNITASNWQGRGHPSSSVPNSIPYQTHDGSQNCSGHTQQTIPNIPSQSGHLPPSLHGQGVKAGFHSCATAGGQPPGVTVHKPGCMAAGETASSLSSVCNSQAVGDPALHNASHLAGIGPGLARSKGPGVSGREVSQSVSPEVPGEGKVISQTQRLVSQGPHTGLAPSASVSQRMLTLQHPVYVSGLSQPAANSGSGQGLPAYHSKPSLPAHGSSDPGSLSQVPVSSVPQELLMLPSTVHSAGCKLAKTMASFPSSSPVVKASVTVSLPSAGPLTPISVGSYPVISSHNMLTTNSISHEMDSRVLVTCTTVSTLQTPDVVKHLQSNTGSSNLATVTISETPGMDQGSVASDLVSDASLGEFALLDDGNPHGDDILTVEDLALISEPGLSALLDMGVRHGTTNGNMSVNTETRAGVNITSMYTKRSSPVNVNMLNHIYAAGLPQPRRLTESVQRLVKPLPNPENSLLPGRACKSPSASSRHSSNGSGSPGRASQGGARSPGVSLSISSPARNLVFDKLIPSLSGHTSGSNSLAPQLARPSFSGGLNCLNTSVIPAAPHPLATLQSSASSRHKAGNGSAVAASVAVTLPSSSVCVASSVTVPSSSVTAFSSLSSPLPATTSSTMSDVAVCSHNRGSSPAVLKDTGSSRLQLDHLSYSVSGPVSKHSVPLLATFHHLHSHQPSPVSVTQPVAQQLESSVEDSVTGRVSNSVVSMPSSPGAVCSRVTIRLPPQAVPPGPHGSLVSVCNTSIIDSVTGKTINPIRSSTALTSLPSVHHVSPVSVSSVVVPSTVGIVQLQPVPVVCSSGTCLQNSSLTCVSSSSDLSSHATNVTAGHNHLASAVTVCSNSSAACKPADLVTPRLVSVGHSVTSSSQQAVGVLGSSCVPQGKNSMGADSSAKTSVEVKSDYPGQTSASALIPSTVYSSSSVCKTEVMSSGRLVPQQSTPVTGDQDKFTFITVTSPMGTHSLRLSPQASMSTSERHRLKEADGEGKVGGEVRSTSVGQQIIQDSAPVSQYGLSENSHSKPPLLHPAAPLTLPALIPSATPPPPPLTPVLLPDSSKKEAITSPHQGQLASVTVGEAGETALSEDRIGTVTTIFLASDPADTISENAHFEEIADCEHSTRGAESIPKDGTSAHGMSSDTGDSESQASELPVALFLDEGCLKTHRLTRKRKSTNSESDSGEPAPKLSCVEGVLNSGNSVDSGTTGSLDYPPKLLKEGKNSQLGEKIDDDKGGKKLEDIHNTEEEENEGKKDEEKAGVKSTTHHDRNILDATPEEVAKKMAAAGSKRRVHYTYVLEKVTPGQSYFDTPVLSGRTRSQGSKGSKESSSASAGGTASTIAISGVLVAGAQPGTAGREDPGDSATAGSKRSTRSLRTKDAAESAHTKRKRAKEHR